MSIETGQTNQSQLDQLDAYVDKRNVSYADARADLGMPPADNTMFTADRIQARLDAHQTHVDLYHVPENPTHPKSTAEQAASIEASQRVVRQAIGSVAVQG